MAEERRTRVPLPFTDEAQRHEAAVLGMWLFLATEIMLFGGLFMGIAVHRVLHTAAADAASDHLSLALGGVNTAVLLTSSLAVALAVLAARAGRRRWTTALLGATVGLGCVFLGIKGYEWLLEYRHGLMPGVGPAFPLEAPAAQLFFNLYFAATGLHALHLLVGIGLVVATAVAAARDAPFRGPERPVVVEMTGRYWHLVDVIWVFLFPVLYMA
jgi:cytochrome c oxidase subunit 3